MLILILRAKQQQQGKGVPRQEISNMFLTFGLEFLKQEQLHPKTLKKILRKTVCAPLPTPLVLTLQSKMVVNSKIKILARKRTWGFHIQVCQTTP